MAYYSNLPTLHWIFIIFPWIGSRNNDFDLILFAGDDIQKNRDTEALASNDELSPFSHQMALYEVKPFLLFDLKLN